MHSTRGRMEREEKDSQQKLDNSKKTMTLNLNLTGFGNLSGFKASNKKTV